MTDTSNELIFQVQEHIARITLNRPLALNALDRKARRALAASFHEAEKDPVVRVVVLDAAGDRAFCTGIDLADFQHLADPDAVRRQMLDDNWVDAIDACSKPVIAAINGHCIAGGFELALAADLRVASASAMFSLTEVRLGIVTGAGASHRLTRMVGLSRAMDIYLGGRKLNASDAHQWGLVHQLVDGDPLPAAMALAERIAACPPLAASAAKALLRAAADQDYASTRKLEAELLANLVPSNDAREAVDAFLNRRTPVFHGR